MSVYVDTGVALAYVIINDPNHDRAESIVASLQGSRFVLSELSVVEMFSVLSRNIEFIEIPGVEIRDNMFEAIAAIILYIIEMLGAEVRFIPIRRRTLGLQKLVLDINDVFAEAIRLATELKLKTLDILHLVYARRIGAKTFLTLDRQIIRNHRTINELMNIEIIPEKIE